MQNYTVTGAPTTIIVIDDPAPPRTTSTQTSVTYAMDVARWMSSTGQIAGLGWAQGPWHNDDLLELLQRREA